MLLKCIVYNRIWSCLHKYLTNEIQSKKWNMNSIRNKNYNKYLAYVMQISLSPFDDKDINYTIELELTLFIFKSDVKS